MKKNTIETLVAYLNGETVTNLDEIKAELETELNKGQARKDATVTAYAEMWETVRQALTDATASVTAQDTSGKSTTYALKS